MDFRSSDRRISVETADEFEERPSGKELEPSFSWRMGGDPNTSVLNYSSGVFLPAVAPLAQGAV